MKGYPGIGTVLYSVDGIGHTIKIIQARYLGRNNAWKTMCYADDPTTIWKEINLYHWWPTPKAAIWGRMRHLMNRHGMNYYIYGTRGWRGGGPNEQDVLVELYYLSILLKPNLSSLNLEPYRDDP